MRTGKRWIIRSVLVIVILLYPLHFRKIPLQELPFQYNPALYLVPIEPISNIHAFEPELESLQQIYRILDSQYVEHSRLIPTNLLLGGLDALAEKYDNFIEYSLRKDLLVVDNSNQETINLCIQNKNEYVFCSKNKVTKAQDGQHLAAKALTKLSFQEYLIRVNNRVFSLNLENGTDIKYLYKYISPIISELSKASQKNVLDIVHDFVNGTLTKVDPHNSFLNAEEYRELHNGTRGYFDGVGITLNSRGDLSIVEDLIPNSPATRAGVKVGDVIVQVNNQIVLFLPVDQTIHLIRNTDPRKNVSLIFYRPSNNLFITTSLRREEINSPTISTFDIPGFENIFYVKLSGFSSNTAKDLYIKYATLQKNHKFKSMILDLRDNPGGLLDEAVEVADLFIKTGKIVSIHSRFDEQNEMASRESRKIDLPLVVLINASSASASEIVAGALKDHNRAIIIGERSFGKGSVQSIFDTGFGTALKITVAHYLTPSGMSIQSKGVVPDISTHTVAEKNSIFWEAGPSELKREAALPLRLNNPESFPFGEGKSIYINSEMELWLYDSYKWMHDNNQIDYTNLEAYLNTWSSEHQFSKEDPVARIGFLLANELQNRSCIPGITPKDCLSDITSIIQELEKQTMPEWSKLYLSQNPRGNTSPLEENFTFPLSVTTTSTRLSMTFGSNKEIITKGMIGIKILTDDDDGPTAWIPVSTLPINQRTEKTLVIDLPLTLRNKLMETTTSETKFEVSWRESFLTPKHFLGVIPYPPVVEENINSPALNLVAKNDCVNTKICHQVILSWPEQLPMGTYDFIIVKLVTKNLLFKQNKTSFSCNAKGCDPLSFKISSLDDSASVKGVFGIIIRNQNGNVVGKWPIISISEKFINIAQLRKLQTTSKKAD